MGAHPSRPCGLVRNSQQTTLDQVISADPAGEIGARCHAAFGPRLPFLLKILAPERALSIQVHPGRAQAEAGFRSENARGIPLRDRARNYVDDWPKPELLCAMTRFEVLAGFRSAGDILSLLDALAVRQLEPAAAQLRSAGRTGALQWVLSQARDQALQEDALTACGRLAAEGGPYAAACGAATRIAADHPGDPGIVASLLLNYSVLEPGDALFMPAGGLHAYIKGVGVELMANSDNVLRAGLTAKHVAIPELLRVVDPAVAVPVIKPRPLPGHVFAYDAPVPEFQLYKMHLTAAATALPDAGPRITLCLDGTAVLESQGDHLKLGSGESCFIPACDGAVTAAGNAVLFIAASGPMTGDPA